MCVCECLQQEWEEGDYGSRLGDCCCREVTSARSDFKLQTQSINFYLPSAESQPEASSVCCTVTRLTLTAQNRSAFSFSGSRFTCNTPVVHKRAAQPHTCHPFITGGGHCNHVLGLCCPGLKEPNGLLLRC